MAVKRRRSTRRARKTSRRERDAGAVRVSFIGKEIQDAVARIRRQADSLPREGRLAARIAMSTLRLCNHHIRLAVNCDFWELK